MLVHPRPAVLREDTRPRAVLHSRIADADVIAPDSDLLSIADRGTIVPTHHPQDFLVFPDFVSPAEELALVELADEILIGREYKTDHYDSVIQNYREFALDHLRIESDTSASVGGGQTVREVVERMRRTALSFAMVPTSGREAAAPTQDPAPVLFPHAQVIDLAPGGSIQPHVDNLKFYGGFTCGLNLLAQSVMRFAPMPAATACAFSVALPPRALYLMRGRSRFSFTHAVDRTASRRLSVMVRDVGEVRQDGPAWRVLLHGLFPKLPVRWLPCSKPCSSK